MVFKHGKSRCRKTCVRLRPVTAQKNSRSCPARRSLSESAATAGDVPMMHRDAQWIYFLVHGKRPQDLVAQVEEARAKQRIRAFRELSHVPVNEKVLASCQANEESR